MAILYVNQQTGNDTNDGTTQALAKKTLAGVDAVAPAGDTIMCTGVFNEIIPNNKQLNWLRNGYWEVNGNGLNVGLASDDDTTIRGATIRNFSQAGVTGYGGFLQDCIFADQPIGLAISGQFFTVQNCQFLNHSFAGVAYQGGLTSQGFTVAAMTNCVFLGNARSIYRNNQPCTFAVTNCVPRDLIMIEGLGPDTPLVSSSNFNAYDFSFGKCRLNGTDYTTLASWKTAANADANSLDLPLASHLGDVNRFSGRTIPGSSLLSSGSAGGSIGIIYPGFTISSGRNASLWTGGIFANCEIDSNGNLVLSAGQSLGTFQSDVIDFGSNVLAQRLEIRTSGEVFPTTYLDYDAAESPGFINYRIRGSASSFIKTAGSPSWVVVPRGAEIGAYINNSLRYWQIELTLRG